MRLIAGLNFYEYVRSSPINLSDPLGLCPNNCPPSGNAPSPRQYQAMGSIAGGSWFFGFGVGAGANLGSLAMFKRGGAIGCASDLRRVPSLRELRVRRLYVRRRISAFWRTGWR